MRRVAGIYLVFMALVLTIFGLRGLLVPQQIMAGFDLQALSPKGTAEVRSLFGGAFLSWPLILLLAWRRQDLRQGLLTALGLTMGGIGLARLLSVAIVEHELAFSLPALAVELLAALACWVVCRADEKLR